MENATIIVSEHDKLRLKVDWDLEPKPEMVGWMREHDSFRLLGKTLQLKMDDGREAQVVVKSASLSKSNEIVYTRLGCKSVKVDA